MFDFSYYYYFPKFFKGFDPLRLSDNIDIRWAQEAELKHCRIAMLAALGFVFADFHNPVLGVSSALAHDAGVKSGAMAQILLWVHFAEIIGTKAVIEMYEGSGREPGYFGFDPLGFYFGKSADVQAKLRENERQNGRLAMLAISGMLTQSVLTGKGFPYF